MDARLGAAGQHRVGVAAPHELSSLADGVRPGSAGRDDRVVRPPDTERDGDLAAGRIDEDVRKKRGRDTGWPALPKDVVLAHQLVKAADARTEHNADTIRLVAVDTRLTDRLLRRRQRKEDATIEPFHLLVGGQLFRAEALHLGSDMDRILAGVEGRDEVDAAPPLDRALPVDATSFPSGVTAPMPVMTTLRTFSHYFDGRAGSPASSSLEGYERFSWLTIANEGVTVA